MPLQAYLICLNNQSMKKVLFFLLITLGQFAYWSNLSDPILDPDNDGVSNYWEMLLWIDPSIHNNRVRIIDWVEGDWNNSDIITVDVPRNLLNIDTLNSGFVVFAWWWSWLVVNTLYEKPDGVNYEWLNDVQDEAMVSNNEKINWDWADFGWIYVPRLTLSWTLVWTWVFPQNAIPEWPNRLSITIKTNTYYPYLFLKYVDYMFWNPLKNYEQYVYLGKLHTDVTSPVCNVILEWQDQSWFEQRSLTWAINNKWVEHRWWWDFGSWANIRKAILSLTWSLPYSNDIVDISAFTWSVFHRLSYQQTWATYTNEYLFADSWSWSDFDFRQDLDTGDENHTAHLDYATGDLVRTATGYIPWSTWSIMYRDTYKDNLSWIHYSLYMVSPNYETYSALMASWTVLRWSPSFSKSWATVGSLYVGYLDYLCSTTNPSDCYATTTWSLNNNVVNVVAFDRAGNFTMCPSQRSKVDTTSPSIIYNWFRDGAWDNNYVEWRWKLELERWVTFDLTLDDSRYDYRFSADWSWVDAWWYQYLHIPDWRDNWKWLPPFDWVSWFRPSDLNYNQSPWDSIWVELPLRVYYCWVWVTDSCKDQLEWNEEKFIFGGETSSWIIATNDQSDLSNTQTWIYFERDAYFAHARILSTPTWFILSNTWWSVVKSILVSRKWLFLDLDNWFKRISWYSTDQIPNPNYPNTLIIFYTWAVAWAYWTSNPEWFTIPKSWYDPLISSWFVATTYQNWWQFAEDWTSNLTGTLALRIFTKSESEGWPKWWDAWHIFFDFKDRAGNKIEKFAQGFDILWRFVAKILGNVQSWGWEYVDDSNVQVFNQNKKTVDEMIAQVKYNLKEEIVWASETNTWFVIVNSLSDLDASTSKSTYWSEIIYVVRKKSIIFWTWAANDIVDLTSTWKNVTIVAYWWNMIINSKFIRAEDDLTLVSLANPELSKTDWVLLEAQGNFLISNNVYWIKAHLIAEWSIFSFAYVNKNGSDKLETVFTFNQRMSLFRTQLLIDGLLMSKNTIWWKYRQFCPEYIYWWSNTCWIRQDQSTIILIDTLALSYDLHYLRALWWNIWLAEVWSNDISNNHVIIRSQWWFPDVNNINPASWFGSPIKNWDAISSINVVDYILNPSNITPSEFQVDAEIYRQNKIDYYPVIIKNVVPSNNIKIFWWK